MLRDLRKQVFKIFVYVKIISLSRLDYAVYDRTRISTTHRIDELPVVPAYTERSDRLLSDLSEHSHKSLYAKESLIRIFELKFLQTLYFR
jgi:hypothetical protein